MKKIETIKAGKTTVALEHGVNIVFHDERGIRRVIQGDENAIRLFRAMQNGSGSEDPRYQTKRTEGTEPATNLVRPFASL